MKTVAVVPSAGRGVRMTTGLPKPYITLYGRPILAYTLGALNAFSCIDEIIVAVDAGCVERVKRIAGKYRIGKLKHVVRGGATRFASVSRCLPFLDGAADYVVIHDGARPFVSESIIIKALRAAEKFGACVVGVPVTSTVKKIDRRLRIVATLPRKELWVAQTPQVFKKALIVEAYGLAKKKKIDPTDDAMLVEQLRKPVKMIMGSYDNIKITSPVDLELAKILIRAGKLPASRRRRPY